MKAFQVVFCIAVLAVSLVGCSSPARPPHALGRVGAKEASAFVALPRLSWLDGKFDPRPNIESQPVDTTSIYGRDSLMDFLYANDASPSDADSVVVRYDTNRRLCFMFFKHEAGAGIFYADSDQNSLVVSDREASFHFETHHSAEGGGMKTSSDVTMTPDAGGGLRFEVRLRVKLDAWGIPYSTKTSMWTFTLRRMRQ